VNGSAKTRAGELLAARQIGESRWPPALALLAFMALNIALRVWLPNDSPVRVAWLVPAIEAVLLVVLIVGPANVPVSRRWVRRVSMTLVVVLVAAALWATTLLIYDLIRGEGITNTPSELLASGAVVWLGNNLSFALLYWLMDGGGPIRRMQLDVPIDFAFTQHQTPELGPDWRPVFLDYLHLGFTNATAFSPTDVMPLTLRAKYAMLVQATVALALFGLIVARAVNTFT
jgi:energy-coupling factor transporter transmembrane protein EcfT